MTHLHAQNATETDADVRTVFRDRGEIIAALTARLSEKDATIAELRESLRGGR